MLLFYGGTNSWASVLTVNGANSRPMKFSFKANCKVNGKIRKDQHCQVIWQVPAGWEFKVNRPITSNDAICIFNPNFNLNFSHREGDTLRAGQKLSYTATMEREILWLNSALCEIGYDVMATMVDEGVARGSKMFIDRNLSSDFTAGVVSSEAIYNGSWEPYRDKNEYNMSSVATAIGGVPSIQLDVTDNIELNPANKVNKIDSKTLFKVINVRNNASGSISIKKQGDAAPLIEFYRNGTISGCQGNYQKANDFCEVRTLPNIDWFHGVKRGTVEVTVVIN